jgi:predicted N-acyltransferase
MQLRWLTSLQQIPPAAWNALFPGGYPFCRHAFLLALEQGGSIDGRSGWQSQHLTVWQDEQLIAAVPGYLKLHSYGEYLFDWQIAEAYQQMQLPYYPKWIAAIPFTPVTGPRLGLLPGTSQSTVLHIISSFLLIELSSGRLQSMQWLYPDAELTAALTQQGFWPRHDVQFLWHNQHYTDFSAFLAQLNSRKRKQLLKERAACAAFNLVTLRGSELTSAHWQQLLRCYQATYLKRSGHHGYITAQSFQLLANTMADQIVVFAAFDPANPVQMLAAALCFQGEDTLYGRYWGALQPNEMLHFELCYYQGIEYCIQHGLRYFDAGAQGEHKLKRGFAPVLRYGAYRFADTPLSGAIQQYFLQEQQHLQQYLAAAVAALPYKKTDNS